MVVFADVKAFRVRIGVAAIVGSVLAAFVLGGVAWAVVSPIDGSGVIHGCYAPSTGAFKLNVTRTCHAKGDTAPITWNQTGPQGPPGPGAQSTTGSVPQGNTGADVSLALAAGSYVATWDLNSSVFTGGCGLGASTNVTAVFSGGSSGLVTVGAGGGTLTIHCGGNGTGGMAELTATPTTIH